MGKMPDSIWVALFSQTGSELLQLIKKQNRHPDVILTNTNTDINPGLYNPGRCMVMHKKHDEIMEWLRGAYPDENIRKRVVVTLHGYLRIIPPDVCARFRIYNGHPGAIDLYPDLKGKDPQVRAWENKGSYKFLGSVVHEVVPEVDAGRIIKSVHLTNTAQSCDDAFDMLRMTSLAAWNFALKEILK